MKTLLGWDRENKVDAANFQNRIALILQPHLQLSDQVHCRQEGLGPSKMNPAVEAAPPEDKRGDDRWMSMHKRFLIAAREQEPDVLFLGDYVVSMAAHTEITVMFEKLLYVKCLNKKKILRIS
ncbi:pafah1b2 [Trichonephila clavipes]|nr:pafah1b2 [Trichonephila clavipes]